MTVSNLVVVQQSLPNTLDSARFTTKAVPLAANADTTSWQKVFEDFSVSILGATTFTITIQIAFLDDQSDAVTVDTQVETERAADYHFTGFGYIRAVRTAATGSNPTVTLNYRED